MQNKYIHTQLFIIYYFLCFITAELREYIYSLMGENKLVEF